jgi:prolyl-tRNA editing enzyme YbaK/EbsC (Cys-tRNA(Pro) deacylase)
MTVLESIRDLLQQRAIPFREVQHGPTLTSQAAAEARGEELKHGGKALLMKIDVDFALFVLPADRRAHSGSIRKELGGKKLRFASREELATLTAFEGRTGLQPGSVPPFGYPILPFPLYVDSAIRENQRIAFNAGSLTDSIVMAVSDYLQVAVPQKIFSFSQVD